MDPYVNINDPVEVDLLYHQSVTDLFEGKIPLTKSDTVSMLPAIVNLCLQKIPLFENNVTLTFQIHLCALRAQSEFGDYGLASDTDYM